MVLGQTKPPGMSGHSGIYAADGPNPVAHLILHDPVLVILAAIVCVAGVWVTLKLFRRAASVSGMQRMGWNILTAVAAGAAIWCTHFIAMLGFEPGIAFSFDPILTIVSLIVAIIGSIAGFSLATSRRIPHAAAFGGAVLGLAIAAMHYTGMLGYSVNGIVTWSMPVLAVSILFAVVLSSLGLHLALRARTSRRFWAAIATMVGAIVLLHFTGMEAFRFEPLGIALVEPMQGAIQALALAIACVGFLIMGAGIASYVVDESVRSDSFEQMRQMAVTDSLTGLPNRVSFNGRLDHDLESAGRQGSKVALVCIDLDRFKEINDLRGHAAGDAVLKTLAERMSAVLREGEFVARLGGDEFAAVKRIETSPELSDFLHRLETLLHKPIRIDGFEVSPGASLGVAIYPDDAGDKLTLVGNADLAMYRAKSTPGSAIAFYDPSMDEIVRKRRALANDLRAALEAGELDVHFQVQKSISTGEIRGYEALVRWTHPERGPISPSEFIPIAEENGLILDVGEWVLRTACARAASWEEGYKVAVNVSPMQFAHADLPKIVLETLIETGLPANRLELELTESTIFSDKERSLHMLRQIKAMGVTIALDDFGTGYSSLDTLRTFPFDKIKLDKSFVDQIESSEQTAAMVRAVLALGRSLNIPVLAEGIENPEQLSVLSTEGCDEVQGFLLGRPQSLSALVQGGGLTLKTQAEPRAPHVRETPESAGSEPAKRSAKS